MFKVLKEFKGSPDGFTVVEYAAGTEVDLAPDLAQVAVKEKWVKELPAKPKPTPDPESERRAADAGAPTSATIGDRLAQMADCESRLAAAPDADKPGIEAELAQLKAAE